MICKYVKNISNLHSHPPLDHTLDLHFEILVGLPDFIHLFFMGLPLLF